MKLYLVRHGHRGYGEEQDTLTDIGNEQAKRIAKFFSNIKIDKIICSSSNRTRKTAEPILKKLNCKIEYTNQVNEQKLGVFEGKSGKEWKTAVEASGLSEEEFRPEEGENRKDAYERAKKFVEKLKIEKAENLLVISHGGFISDVITLLLNLLEKESIHFKTGFSAISYFKLDKGLNVEDFYIGDLTPLGKFARS